MSFINLNNKSLWTDTIKRAKGKLHKGSVQAREIFSFVTDQLTTKNFRKWQRLRVQQEKVQKVANVLSEQNSAVLRSKGKSLGEYDAENAAYPYVGSINPANIGPAPQFFREHEANKKSD